MSNVLQDIKINKIILEKIKFEFGTRIPKDTIRNMKIEQWVDLATMDLVVKFETFLFGRKIKEEIKEQQVIYHSWWDFFKARHCPIWFIKRFPAKQHWQPIRITHYHICPHTGIMTNSDKKYEEIAHFNFLKGAEEEGQK